VRTSAGIILHRVRAGRLQILIGHMGGPLHARKATGSWSIPKGEYGPDEDPETVARREFEEEMGSPIPAAELVPLGTVRQSKSKLVTAWAARGDLDAERAVSNTFTMEWPPGSGHRQEFPEIDRAEWVDLPTARERLIPGQLPLLDTLTAALGIDPSGMVGGRSTPTEGR
jgi:predicted NUDIX family NTP pyrophosphohydrolase